MAWAPADNNMRSAYGLIVVVLIAAVAQCAEAAAEASDSASVPAPEGSTPGGTTAEPYSRVLPFLADEAIKAGHDLPLPFGAGVILTGLDNRKIDVSDVRVGLQNRCSP
jgi:hypothetical protein